MNNDSIQFGQPIDPEVPQEQLPPLDLSDRGAQALRGTPFRVYILKQARATILEHVFNNQNIENGGLLVGHPFKTFIGDITFVVVTAALPQHSQDRSRIHFTVGPDESAKARRLLAAKYPGQVVVGWYHSHPGHGVFLSDQDKAIAHSIYNLPWHIAVVIDPLQSTEAIFVGKEGTRLSNNNQDKLGSSWINLEKTPDSIKAIALYNRIKEGEDDLIHRLAALVKTSDQLKHWEDRYQDLALPSTSKNPRWLKLVSLGSVGMILTAVICAFGAGLLYSNPNRFFGLFFTATPTPTSTSTATPTFTSTATATPTSTATHTATATATATSTHTATPASTPESEELPQSSTRTPIPPTATSGTITNTGAITTTLVITSSSNQE